MSASFQGYRAAENTDPFVLGAQIRAAITTIRYRTVGEIMAHQLVCRLENRTLGIPTSKKQRETGQPEGMVDDLLGVMEIGDFFDKAIGRNETNLAFWAVLGSHEDRLYVRTYTENAQYLDALARLEGLEDFFYQNYSDVAPEGVTEAQWEDRGRIWAEIAPDGAAPVTTGLSIELGEGIYPFGPEEILRFQPDLADRAESIVERVAEHHGLKVDAVDVQDATFAVTGLTPVTVEDMHAEVLSGLTVDVDAVLERCSG